MRVSTAIQSSLAYFLVEILLFIVRQELAGLGLNLKLNIKYPNPIILLP